MLHLSLRQWEVFCAIAHSGSTVAAARTIGLSQSAVSAALQQLEAGLGAQLFSRIDGDQFVIRGLPLLAVLDYLRVRGMLPS